jgi:sec-independent protein translocase protein TatA
MDLGPPELLIILVVVLLLFGGAKVPELARSLGKAKREFEKGVKGDDQGPKAEASKPATPETPAALPPAATGSAAPSGPSRPSGAAADAGEPVPSHRKDEQPPSFS